jgi:PEGA domain
MDSALASRIAPSVPIVFQDALGERRRLDGNGADPVEVLCLRSELTAIPSFEFALRERASRLASFRHANYGRVRGVDRLNDAAATLAVVSDHTRGLRLSALLSEAGPRPITIDITVALHFIRQLVSAVGMLHDSARDAAHGAVGPERIIVTPNARIVVVEYVLGAALEQLRFSRERYWRELRIALPPSPGLPRFDHRADVTQIGVVALSLILGRVLHEDEYIAHAGDLVASASAMAPKGGVEPLPAGLRTWLSRALQLDARHSFASAPEARAELDKLLAADPDGAPKSMAVHESVEHGPHPAEASRPARAEAEPSQQASKGDAHRAEGGDRRSDSHVEASAEPRPAASVAPSVTEDTTVGAEKSDRKGDPEPYKKNAKRPTSLWRSKKLAVIVAATTALMVAGAYGTRRLFMAPVGAAQVTTGTLNVNTNPAGAEVRVDGQRYGVTPLTIALKPGPHNVEIRGTGDPRMLPVTIAAGTQVTQYIEMPGPATAALGALQVRTEPPGAPVSVDGVSRGRSPVLVEGLRPGDHIVVVESEFGSMKQTVAVTAATTASLVVPLERADGAPVSGWVSVAAPVDVQILENKRLLGTSQSERIMVSAGRHELEIVNEVLGYRTVKVVQVPAGRVTPIKLEWPRGTIAVNAVPWAEVWIDGERVGETPIGNQSLPIGPHEILFRHPELGELRHAATVTVNTPARVSVDMRKKP